MQAEQFKSFVIDLVKQVLNEEGRIMPVLFINTDEESDYNSVIPIPLPPEAFDSYNAKLLLTRLQIPKALYEIERAGKKIITTAYCSEAWLRATKHKEGEPMPDSSTLPVIGEIVYFAFDDGQTESSYWFQIMRDLNEKFLSLINITDTQAKTLPEGLFSQLLTKYRNRR